MSFLTGLILVDAPASALNNAETDSNGREFPLTNTKHIRTKEGIFPYVSAQAFRYWLRCSLEKAENILFSPIEKEKNSVAYTSANPIEYFDDDILGYMRAKTGGGSTLTRISPFRTSTFIALDPISRLTEDLGTMSRHNDNPVPFKHQLYRTTLKGLVSLDLYSSGRFWATERTGFKNLDEERIKIAKELGLEEGQKGNATFYKLSNKERINRINALLKGIANLEGGAKQTLHYTDVNPAFIIMAVTKGGNNIFNRTIQPDSKGLPVFNKEVMDEVLSVYKEEILSPIYIGLPKGYIDSQKPIIESCFWKDGIILKHPKEIMADIVEYLNSKPELLD